MTKRVYRKYELKYSIDSLDPSPIVKIFNDWFEVEDYIDSLKLKTEYEYSLLQIREFDDNWNEL